MKKEYNISKKDKIILYAGRVTLQKGPEYFIRAAKKVLEYEPNTKFVIAGTGEQVEKCVQLAKELDISENILFHGFYNREEANLFFTMADVFVMPSVLEPFGIVPLEAMAKGTPTIITNQSGISEVLNNTFKIDFWDIDEMAHKILALIKYEPLHREMRENGYNEVDKFNWNIPAEKIVNIYNSLV
jgi:glycosyltransferase involved in cell wall biosynthesis